MKKEISVFICTNSLPADLELPGQLVRNDIHVDIRKLPCSGKISVEYLLHAVEGGKCAVGVVTCTPGTCTLFQGNYRAHIRTSTVRQLLGELGMPPEMIRLMHFSKEMPKQELEHMLLEFVDAVHEKQDKE